MNKGIGNFGGVIIVAIILMGGIGGYFSVRQYQNYQAEKKKQQGLQNVIVDQKIKNNNDPKSALIAEFLKNPTLENFGILCASAKNIESKTTKQVLDSSREKMITVKQSLYYDDGMIDCRNLDDNKRGVYFLPLDNSSLIALQDNDTDEVRAAKIIFNDKIKNLMATSKIKFALFYVPADNVSPTELFQTGKLQQYRLEGLSGYFE